MNNWKSVFFGFSEVTLGRNAIAIKAAGPGHMATIYRTTERRWVCRVCIYKDIPSQVTVKLVAFKTLEITYLPNIRLQSLTVRRSLARKRLQRKLARKLLSDR